MDNPETSLEQCSLSSDEFKTQVVNMFSKSESPTTHSTPRTGRNEGNEVSQPVEPISYSSVSTPGNNVGDDIESINFFPGRTPMSSAFHAELGLLEALKKPRKEFRVAGKSLMRRKAHKDVPWLSAEENLRESLRATDYLTMSKKELENFRRNPADGKSARERGEDIAAVCSLSTQVTHDSLAEPGTRNSRVHGITKSRQLRHDQVLELYRQNVINISEDIEHQVIDAGRKLRDELAEYDSQLSMKMQEIEKDNVLQQQEYEYLVHAWDDLAEICKRRKRSIKDFGKRIGSFEKQRAQTVGNLLKELIDDMVLIGYCLRSEVERIVEEEAHEVNLVIIANLKALADLEARMLKEQVSVYFKLRGGWEVRETRWRELRHERALNEWELLINSKAFTNPERRIKILEEMKEKQLKRQQETRCVLLEELQQLTPHSPKFTITELKRIGEAFNNLDKEEKEENLKYMNKLKELQGCLSSEMHNAQELLRAELHRYAALTENGDVYTRGLRGNGSLHGEKINQFISNSQLEDFFRKAGGLKSELLHIIKVLREPDLIYEDDLDSLSTRVRMLVNATTIERILHKQGKVEDKKNLEYTLEKLRTASKAQLAPLVPVLFNQTKALCQIKGVPVDVKAELMTGLKLLQEVHPSISLSLNFDDSKSVVSQATLRVEGTDEETKGEEVQGGDQARHPSNAHQVEAPKLQKVQEGNALESQAELLTGTPGAKTQDIGNFKSAELAYKEKPLNLVDLRMAQRKIGAVVKASGLPKEIKAELVKLKASLNHQVEANRLIDDVVVENCHCPIEQREEEYSILLDQVDRALRDQTQTLFEQQKRICQFYIEVVQKVDNAACNEDATDLHFDKAVDSLYDQFEEQDKKREEDFQKAIHSTRHAPNEQALHVSMARALEILEEIKLGYREYHRDGIALAKQHPEKALSEATEYMNVLCNQFHLIAPPLEFGCQEATQAIQEDVQVIHEGIKVVDDCVRTDSSGSSRPGSRPSVRSGVSTQRPGSAVSTATQQAPVAKEVCYRRKRDEGDDEKEEEMVLLQGNDYSPIVGLGGTVFEQKMNACQLATELLHGPKKQGVLLEEEEESSEESYLDSEEELESQVGGEMKEDEGLEDTNDVQEEIEEGEFSQVHNDTEEGDQKESGETTSDPEKELTEVKAVDEGSSNEESTDPTSSNETSDNGTQDGKVIDSDAVEEVQEVTATTTDAEEAEVKPKAKKTKKKNSKRRKSSESLNVNDLEPENTFITAESLIPHDEDGSTCIAAISVDLNRLISMILELRKAAIECMDKHHKERLAEMIEISKERCDGYTEELEERLRLHWPRKGRTDVKYQQPRYGELLHHQQRHDRHIRAIKLKTQSQDKRFETCLQDAEKHAEQFKDRLELCSRHLELQGNLASLQGIYKRGKESLLVFRKEAKQSREALKAFVNSEPQSLLDMNRVFLDTCITFEKGGDYNEEELELERLSLSQVNESVNQVIASRAKRLHAVVAKQKEAQQGFKQFQQDFERCLQSLSMGEGLGQKYGAPRRNAQDRLRNEILQSDSAALRLEELIGALKKLLASPPGAPGGCKGVTTIITQPQPGAAGGGAADGPAGTRRRRSSVQAFSLEPRTKALSVQVQQCLDSIRKCLFRRGEYLEFLKHPVPARPSLPVEVYDPSGYLRKAEAARASADQHDTESSAEPAPPLEVPEHLRIRLMDEGDVTYAMFADSRTTFSATVSQAEGACVLETQELFEREGKLGELGPSGIPDSLQTFLCDLKQRAEAYRNKAAAQLREQVREVEQLMVAVPSVVMEDIVETSRQVLGCAKGIVAKELEARSKHWSALRNLYQQHLRPRLGETDNRDELEELCAKEQRRQKSALQGIQESRQRTVDAILDQSAECLRCLLSSARWFVECVCGTVLLCHLDALPGDDQVHKERKGLRRLKHQMEKRMALERERADTIVTSAGEAEGEETSVATPQTLDVPLMREWSGVELVDLQRMATVLDGCALDDQEEEKEAEQSESITGYSIAQVRKAVLVRNRLYKQSVTQFESNMRDALRAYDMRLERENVANGNWNQMVKFLLLEKEGEVG